MSGITEGIKILFEALRAPEPEAPKPLAIPIPAFENYAAVFLSQPNDMFGAMPIGFARVLPDKFGLTCLKSNTVHVQPLQIDPKAQSTESTRPFWIKLSNLFGDRNNDVYLFKEKYYVPVAVSEPICWDVSNLEFAKGAVQVR